MKSTSPRLVRADRGALDNITERLETQDSTTAEGLGSRGRGAPVENFPGFLTLWVAMIVTGRQWVIHY